MKDKEKNLTYDELDELINCSNIMTVGKDDLFEIYMRVDELTQLNIYFQLLNIMIGFEEIKDKEKIAYVSHLISYYVFNFITPPHAEEIALMYAGKSIQFDNKYEYVKWREFVLEEN